MKNKCGILIDSSCCYDPQFIIENNVEVVPLSLSDGHNILYTDDNKKIDASTLLSRLDNGEVFKTSATPLGQLQLKIEDMLEKYENVIFLPISSGLSSQYHQSLIIKQDFPDRLFVVNSLSAASANEFILFHLVEWVKEGKDPQVMVTDAEQLYSNIVTFFSCEDVRGIISGGRGSKNVLHAIKFLRLKPIIQLDNKNQYAGIATNYKNAMKKIIAKIRSDYEGVELNAENIIRISIYYSGYEQEKRSYIINALVEAFNFPIEKITVRWLPATVLIHTRFGSYGVSVETNISHKQKQYK